MEDGKCKRAGEFEHFAIFHLPFAMQDAFFNILLGAPGGGVGDDGTREAAQYVRDLDALLARPLGG